MHDMQALPCVLVRWRARGLLLSSTNDIRHNLKFNPRMHIAQIVEYDKGQSVSDIYRIAAPASRAGHVSRKRFRLYAPLRSGIHMAFVHLHA
jgi:hypothetical protein